MVQSLLIIGHFLISDLATKADNGIDNASEWLGRPVPEVYSADLSEFVLAAGVKILKEWSPNLMYLSTTDYVQHKFAPNQQGAKDFYLWLINILENLTLWVLLW